MKALRQLGVFVLLTNLGAPALGQGDEYSRLGIATYSAFKCSIWANMVGRSEEESRLFDYGREAGRRLIESVTAEAVDPVELWAGIPSAVAVRLEGPSVDFMLGRIYEAALREVIRDADLPEDSTAALALAELSFRNANCSLIGDQEEK